MAAQMNPSPFQRTANIILLWCCGWASHPAWAADTVIIGAEDDWAPYSYKSGPDAKGYSVDIVREAFKASGIEVRFISLPFARCMSEVDNGQLVGCFNAVRNSKSEKRYLWHRRPLVDSRSVIYSLASSAESGLQLKDLEGKTVGVTNGYEYGEDFDTNTKIIRDPSNQDELGFKKLLAGRFQYMVSFDKVANSLFATNKDFAGKFKTVGIAAEAKYYMVFSKKHPGSTKYLAAFDQGFDAIVKNGTHRAIEAKWP